MPIVKTVQVFNWTPERGFWFSYEPREYETYEEEVARVAEELRAGGHADKPILHEAGECVVCDALRKLENEWHPMPDAD